MYIIVGLGNPGSQYEHTRHNVGFDVVNILAQQYDIPLNRTRFKGRCGEGHIGGQKVVLVQPQTYMNLSGECVAEVMNWYKEDMSHLVVVYDDIDLPEGKLRVRGKGSAGTHNGMRNIIAMLGRDDFSRIRVGIGRPPEGWQLADYVLSRFMTQEQREGALASYKKAAKLVEILIREGVESASCQAGSL